MQGYLKLLHFLKDHKKLFGVAVVAMFFSSLFEGFQISFLIPVTDRIFNKKEIVEWRDLIQTIQTVKIGQKVIVKIKRHDKVKSISVKIGERKF